MMHSAFAPLLVAGACLALAVPSPTSPQDAEATDEPETVLAVQMEEIEAHLAKLRRTLRDETKRAESLAHITGIQLGVVVSKAEIPAMTDSLPEVERAAFETAYRRDMVTMLKDVCDLELAVLDGDTDLARTLFKAIRKLEDPGHERFTEDG